MRLEFPAPLAPIKGGDVFGTAIAFCRDRIGEQAAAGELSHWRLPAVAGLLCVWTLVPKVELRITHYSDVGRRGGNEMAVENRQEFVSSGKVIHLQPYWDNNQQTWVIDDPPLGLSHEPFVNGYPDFLDRLLRDVPDASRGFRIELSDCPFPGFASHLIRQDHEYGGYWYASDDPAMKGWFGPVLERYFKTPPADLFVRIEPLATVAWSG